MHSNGQLFKHTQTYTHIHTHTKAEGNALQKYSPKAKKCIAMGNYGIHTRYQTAQDGMDTIPEPLQDEWELLVAKHAF